MNVPGVRLAMPYMSQKDRDDILFGAQQGFDFIAASFVRSAEDVREIRRLLDSVGSKIRIIAKIENQEGISNLSEIIAVADGVMVARGDMGVEIDFTEIPDTAKTDDCPVHGLRQAGHHRHPDAGLHDRASPAHQSGDNRRGQRHL
ncbi:MAG: pyruvate kinase [Oscillospiraceae bacterium]